MSAPFLMSLRPQFADLIFDGLKRAELRRRFSAVAVGREVYIYVTSPKMVLRGGFRIDDLWHGSPDHVWGRVKALAGMERAAFDAYFEGSTLAYALRISEVWEFEEPIGIDCLKEKLGSFVVPQSWRYVKPTETRTLMEMRERMKILPERDHKSRTKAGKKRIETPKQGERVLQEASWAG